MQLMIPISTLKYLIVQKTKDAQSLLSHKRNSSAIYLMGYAVEYALKRKICATLNFYNGFPESNPELLIYISYWASTGTPSPISFNKIKEIKHHDLEKLLAYSGVEPTIKALFLNEWEAIAGWNPEDRYKIQRVSRDKAETFIKSAKKIIRELL
jgi:HEPN domain-containing protein